MTVFDQPRVPDNRVNRPGGRYVVPVVGTPSPHVIQIQDKLRQVGAPAALRAVDILDIILRDEIGHVAIGNHWYRWLCEREGLDPVAQYPALADRYAAPKLHPPFNAAARLQAGFSAEEVAALHR